ncbi:MAG: disulfide bond formation protein B [Hyphomicrobiales bacterium]|nr:disulfide bond formation protein B [Hyphomicrobiales bacterium]
MDSSRRREMLAPAIIVAVGGAAILAAWGFELIGGFVPCKLCLQERVPYYVGLPIALAALLAALAGAKPTVVRMLLMVAGLVFAVNVYLGVYHAGAEWGWWAGPADCGAAGGPVDDVNDLLNQLDNIRIVSCTEATWRLLGLSFAGWNAAVSVFLVATAFWGAFRPLADRAPSAA